MCEETRQNYLQEINKLITAKCQVLEKICEDIGWNVEQSRMGGEAHHVTCPLESGHLVASSNLDKHVSQCSWRRGSYSKDDLPFPQCFEGGGTCVTLGAEEHGSVLHAAGQLDVHSITDIEVPQSASRLYSCFTPQQRLKLYEHVVQNTPRATSSLPLTELDLAFEAGKTRAEGSKSFLEALAEQRDAKRRRLNYRQAKHVHTKHKSQTEVAREVISNQMELYEQWLLQQSENLSDHSHGTEKKLDKERPHPSNIQSHRREESLSRSSKQTPDLLRHRGDNHDPNFKVSRRGRLCDYSHSTEQSPDVVRRRDYHYKPRRREESYKSSRSEHKREKHNKKRHRSHSSERHKHSKKSRKYKDKDY